VDLIEHGEMGARGYSAEDVLDMNLEQTRAILNGGKRKAVGMSGRAGSLEDLPKLEDVLRHKQAWHEFLVREYGAVR